MSSASSTCAAVPAETEVRRQIACATLKLRRYRLARDRAQMERLKNEPHLFQLIAGVIKLEA